MREAAMANPGASAYPECSKLGYYFFMELFFLFGKTARQLI